MSAQQYIIRGGVAGRERLRLLSRVMRDSTLELFRRAGLRPGMRCLDCGCGGGDVSFELARLVGSDGFVLGIDIDELKLELARSEAADLRLGNVEFRRLSIDDGELRDFDVVYARFLLTHLRHPERIVEWMWAALRPGGLLVVEDIDFRGHFSDPECAALRRYVDLYTLAVARRGGDANIGPRLPGMLRRAGCRDVQMHVAHPAGLDGEVKLINAVTMESIADALLAEGLADRAEIEAVVRELHAFACDPHSVMSVARVVQAWGHRPQPDAGSSIP
jgi:ubiquinone/menaquinone biosynthesis C-methylase UbiE